MIDRKKENPLFFFPFLNFWIFMLNILSVQAYAGNATEVASMSCPNVPVVDISKICQESILSWQSHHAAEKKLRDCLGQWNPLNVPASSTAKKYKPLREDTIAQRVSHCSALRKKVDGAISELRCKAQQERIFTRGQIFPMHLCARGNFLDALARRSENLVIGTLFALNLALRSSMEEVSEICLNDQADQQVLYYVPDSVLGISTGVDFKVMEQQKKFFPKLVKEIDSGIEELRKIEKEGEDLIWSTPEFLINHIAKRMLSWF